MGAVAVERTLDDALRKNLLVEVDYVTDRGTFTRRVMEPLSLVHDYSARKHILWGRCFEHNRVEARALKRIVSIRIVELHTSERKTIRRKTR